MPVHRRSPQIIQPPTFRTEDIMTSSYISCELPKLKKGEGRTVDQLLTSPQHRQVYRHLRRVTGTEQFSYRGLASELGFPSVDSISRALEKLSTIGLVTRTWDAGTQFVSVNPVDEHAGLPRTFRGSSAIDITAYSAAVKPALSQEEEDQLFLKFRGEPDQAALYIFLREKLPGRVTKQEIGQRFGIQVRTLNKSLDELAECGLIEVRQASNSISLRYANLGFDEEVEREVVREWLAGCAAVPTIDSAESAALRHSLNSPEQQLWKFYSRAMEARKLTPVRGPDKWAAKNLTAQAPPKAYLAALLFFVFEWRGENVDLHGRSLTTFSKNLGAIQEETKLETNSNRNYVREMMLRYRLDKYFPVPALKEKPKQDQTAKILASLKHWDYDLEMFDEDSPEAQYVREHGMPSE